MYQQINILVNYLGILNYIIIVYKASKNFILFLFYFPQKPPIDSSSESGKMPSSLEGNITLKNVYFSYPARPDVPVSI